MYLQIAFSHYPSMCVRVFFFFFFFTFPVIQLAVRIWVDTSAHAQMKYSRIFGCFHCLIHALEKKKKNINSKVIMLSSDSIWFSMEWHPTTFWAIISEKVDTYISSNFLHRHFVDSFFLPAHYSFENISRRHSLPEHRTQAWYFRFCVNTEHEPISYWRG